MKIKQLSIFLENKTGRINQVAKTLGNNGINMIAFSLAESDCWYPIPQKQPQYLKKNISP